MGKDSSPTLSHFPMTRRYSSSITHHILEKVCSASSQAHKCGEKELDSILRPLTHGPGIPRPLAPASPASLAPLDFPALAPLMTDSDLHSDTPTPPVTPTPTYLESSSGHPSLSPLLSSSSYVVLSLIGASRATLVREMQAIGQMDTI
ncbi:hypothetical protein AAG906_041178 [Vitis piasezkii]